MIQPKIIVEPDPEKNVEKALFLVEKASKENIDLILFPEGYPGPILRKPRHFFDAYKVLRESAKKNSISICWSRMEYCSDGHYRLVVYVLDSNGNEVLRYPRTHPATLPISETEVWVAPGELGPPIFKIKGVLFSVIVCSELWTPEYVRLAGLGGAEVILSPAGGGFTSLKENWEIIARARAIENLCYVALTNNIWKNEKGSAMIIGPEKIEKKSGTKEMISSILDLERVSYLRSKDDSIKEPKAFSSIPGLLRARRPELYKELSKSQLNAFDYHKNISKEKVKKGKDLLYAC